MPSPLNVRQRLRRVFSRDLVAPDRTAPAASRSPPAPALNAPLPLTALEKLFVDPQHTTCVRTAGNGRYASLFTAAVDSMLSEIRRTRHVLPIHCQNSHFLGLCVVLVSVHLQVEYDEAVETVATMVQCLAEAEMQGTLPGSGWMEAYGAMVANENKAGRMEAFREREPHDDGLIDWVQTGAMSDTRHADEPIDWVKAGARSEPQSDEEWIDWVKAGALSQRISADVPIDWFKAGELSEPNRDDEPIDWVKAGAAPSATMNKRRQHGSEGTGAVMKSTG
jgi:hypothetical protein